MGGKQAQQVVRMLPLQIPVESDRDSEQRTMFNPVSHLWTLLCVRVCVSVHERRGSSEKEKKKQIKTGAKVSFWL